jgi:hypothetical protein
MNEYELAEIFLANNLSTSKVIEHLKKHEISIPPCRVFLWAFDIASFADFQTNGISRHHKQN